MHQYWFCSCCKWFVSFVCACVLGRDAYLFLFGLTAAVTIIFYRKKLLVLCRDTCIVWVLLHYIVLRSDDKCKSQKPLFRRPFDKHPQPGRHSIHVIICYHSFVSQTIFIFIFWCRQRNKKATVYVLDFELLPIVLRLHKGQLSCMCLYWFCH